VNFRIRRKLAERKRRMMARLDKTKFGGECPVISASNIHYELADRTQAISAGGIGMIHQMVSRLGLADEINRHLGIFKIYVAVHSVRIGVVEKQTSSGFVGA
jgi:hypothetical protein